MYRLTQDFVVVHVAREARRPEREADPEAQGGRRVDEVHHGGGKHEKRGEEEAVPFSCRV